MIPGFSKIDRYILKKLFTTFLFVVVLLTVVICAIDYTEKNDQFLKTNPSATEIIFDYYMNFVPYWIHMLSPITVFIVTIFVTARMASHTETVAIFTSGISFNRFLVPFLIGTALIGGLIFWFGGWVLPYSTQRMVPFETKYLKNPYYYDGRDVHMKIGPNTYAYLESYNNKIEEGYLFSLEHIENQRLKSKIKADKIKWSAGKKTWELHNFTRHTFTDSNETVTTGARLDTIIDLSPSDFDNPYLREATFTLPKLIAYINKLKSRGAENIRVYQVELMSRYSYPITIVILGLIGVLVSVRKSREGPGFKIALGFLLAFIYIILFMLCRSIAIGGGLNEFTGVWLPNILFLFVGMYLYFRVPK